MDGHGIDEIFKKGAKIALAAVVVVVGLALLVGYLIGSFG